MGGRVIDLDRVMQTAGGGSLGSPEGDDTLGTPSSSENLTSQQARNSHDVSTIVGERQEAGEEQQARQAAQHTMGSPNEGHEELPDDTTTRHSAQRKYHLGYFPPPALDTL